MLAVLATVAFLLYWYPFRQKKLTARKDIFMKFKRDIAGNKPRLTKRTKSKWFSSDRRNSSVCEYYAWWKSLSGAATKTRP